MAGLGLFDNVDEIGGAELAKGAWFDTTMYAAGWFSIDLIEVTVAAAFDAALMAAMNRPWPDIVFQRAKVVASGMKPTNLVNN